MKINRSKEFGIIEVPLLIILGLASIAGVFYGGIKFSESRQKNKAAVSEIIRPNISPVLSPTFTPIFEKPAITSAPTIVPAIKSQTVNQRSITIAPTKTILSMANWKTYKNGNLGFELKYPNNWAINNFESQRIIFNQPDDGFWLMDITIETNTNSFENNVQSRFSSLKSNNSQISLSDTVIGRVSGKKINVRTEGGEIVQYLLQDGDRFYTIVFRSESEENNAILKSFQLIPISDFSLINGNYKITRNTSTELFIQGPGYSGNVKDLPLNFYKFKKSAGQKLEDWIEQNKNNLPSPISFDGNCYSFGSSETITIYNCGRMAEQDYIVNKGEDSILFISQGQDPPLTASDLLNLISFR